MSIKILIVEDDFANQQVALLFLKKLGYDADIAEDGHKALELVESNSYQLILMDCQMPILNGFEATKKIRSTPGINQTTPIIALTANLVEGINQKCFESGMNDVLNKPINMDILGRMVKQWIERDSND